MSDELAVVLNAAARAEPIGDLAAWLPRWRTLAAQGHDAVGLALRGARLADRLAWAFCAGYQAALRALPVARPAEGAVFGLSVTEAGGNRPRDIAARLRRGADGVLRLDGRKRWATLAPVADALLVVARDDTAPAADDRPRLAAAWVRRAAPGVAVQPMPTTAFVAEVPHAELVFEGVALADDDRVPGDAYASIVKPFRTLEDLFVALAALAWLACEARARGWPRTLIERLCAVIESLIALSRRDPGAAATHVALAGALALAAELHEAVDAAWAGDDPSAVRWRADRALFAVAGAPRRLRTERAWQQLGGSGRGDPSAAP